MTSTGLHPETQWHSINTGPLLSQVGLSMARLARYVISGRPQHIIQRGNNRQAIFAAEADYPFFRDALVEAAGRFGLAIQGSY